MEEIKQVKFTNYEQDVLNTFFKIVREAGPYGLAFGYRTYTQCGYCIQKEGDMWISYHMERNDIGGRREFKDVYDMAVDLFDTLDKNGTDYCVAHFPTKKEFKARNQVKQIETMPEDIYTDNIEQAELTSYEKDVFDTFMRIVNEAGPYDDTFGYRTYAECGYCIQKKGDIWSVYGMERAIKHGYLEYADVYDMAIDLFKSLDEEGREYCLAHFPSKIIFKARNQVKQIGTMKGEIK